MEEEAKETAPTAEPPAVAAPVQRVGDDDTLAYRRWPAADTRWLVEESVPPPTSPTLPTLPTPRAEAPSAPSAAPSEASLWYQHHSADASSPIWRKARPADGVAPASSELRASAPKSAEQLAGQLTAQIIDEAVKYDK